MRGLTLAAGLFALSGIATGEVIRFEGCGGGELPPRWIVAMTHAGGAPRWGLVADSTAPGPPCVFAQLSTDATAGRFPIAIWQGADFRDGEVSVSFKPVAGVVDQAAGIVWRYRDANNYYIVRANTLENNVVLYKVRAGVRASIAPKGLPSRAYGVKHPIAKGRWSALRVTFRKDLFTVFLNGERLFEAQDATFSSAGKTGLWTKSDSVTYFDNFEAKQDR